MKHALSRLFKRWLVGTGIPFKRRLMRARGESRPLFTTLMFHSLRPSYRHPEVRSGAEKRFADFLDYLGRHYDLVSSDWALDFLAGRAAPKRAPLLLTFDDATRDTYEVAFPLLKAKGFPALIFMPTEPAENGRMLWYEALAALLQKTKIQDLSLALREETTGAAPEYRIELDAQITPEQATRRQTWRLPEERAAAEQVLSAAIAGLPGEVRWKILERLAERLEVALPPARELFMTWDEARTMQAAGMEFGGHTHSHPVLSRLDTETLKEELATSRRILSERLGRVPRTFCYPRGNREDISTTVEKAVAEAGFELAFVAFNDRMPLDTTCRFAVRRQWVGANLEGYENAFCLEREG